MTARFGYTVIASAMMFGLVGCGGSGGGSAMGGHAYHQPSTPIVPSKTLKPIVSVGNTTNQSPQPTTPSTQPTTTRPTIATTGTTNTTTPSAKPTTLENATSFTTKVNDSRDLNITRVVRPTGELAKEVQEVVRLTNQLRAEKGLKPLIYDENLSAYAQVRAVEYEITKKRANSAPNREWGNKLAHQRIDGRSFSDGHTGFGGVSENLAPSRKNAMQAVKSWQESSGHYANMMNETHERIGVGVVYIPNSQYGYYWAQVFASGTASFPYEFVDVGRDNPEPLRQVMIDGRKVSLSEPHGQWQRFDINLTSNAQGWVSGYDQTRFGVLTPQGSNEAHLFYQGNQTLDYAIPKSGTANYQGTALVIKDGKTDTNIDSRFTANFGTRKLNGTLSQRNNTLYTISADINGSSFASKANAPVQTQGAFFGQNAEELAGVFKDTKTNARGVYGAKK